MRDFWPSAAVFSWLIVKPSSWRGSVDVHLYSTGSWNVKKIRLHLPIVFSLPHLNDASIHGHSPRLILFRVSSGCSLPLAVFRFGFEAPEGGGPLHALALASQYTP